MSIRADVFRNGAIFAVISPVRVELDQRISSADSAILQFPPGIYYALPGDEIDLYDCTDIVSGEFIGTFRVVTIETIFGANGITSCKLTMLPIAAFLLSSTGTPGENVVGGITLIQAAANIEADTVYLTGEKIQLNFVNPDGYPGGNKFDLSEIPRLGPDLPITTSNNSVTSLTIRRSSRVINASATTTFLELLNTILVPSDGRWRCRPDYTIPTIELGWFGDKKEVFIRAGSPSVVPVNIGNTYFPESVTEMIDDDNTINSLFIEGGTWTSDKGFSSSLLLWHYLNVSDGFAVRAEGYPDGVGHFRIDKLFDDDGVPYTWRRSKRVTVGSIVPDTTNGSTPNGAQVVAASQQLLEAGIDYLQLHCRPQQTWTAEIAFSTLGKFDVGDKIHILLINETGGIHVSGYVFVVSRRTLWSVGGRTTELEMSTILESLVDPLSKEYGKVVPSIRSVAKQGNYTVTLVCNPTGTYTFSVYSAAVPDIINVTTNVGVATMTSLNAITVSFSTTGGTGTPATVKVTFMVVPKG